MFEKAYSERNGAPAILISNGLKMRHRKNRRHTLLGLEIKKTRAKTMTIGQGVWPYDSTWNSKVVLKKKYLKFTPTKRQFL